MKGLIGFSQNHKIIAFKGVQSRWLAKKNGINKNVR